jgi:hypothetical protein
MLMEAKPKNYHRSYADMGSCNAKLYVKVDFLSKDCKLMQKLELLVRSFACGNLDP